MHNLLFAKSEMNDPNAVIQLKHEFHFNIYSKQYTDMSNLLFAVIYPSMKGISSLPPLFNQSTRKRHAVNEYSACCHFKHFGQLNVAISIGKQLRKLKNKDIHVMKFLIFTIFLR